MHTFVVVEDERQCGGESFYQVHYVAGTKVPGGVQRNTFQL